MQRIKKKIKLLESTWYRAKEAHGLTGIILVGENVSRIPVQNAITNDACKDVMGDIILHIFDCAICIVPLSS